mmetsp:Transcript_33991/g.109111  ORF Transcript_33991/g.109111 Transcript_33991/m.109111 type:complete len:180 (+) Transcript_33991:329-868(+)
MENLYQSTRSLLTGEPRQQTVAQQIEDECCDFCPKLTYKQRLIGFAVCFGVGMLLEFGSFLRIIELIQGKPGPFAIMYSVGNIVAICGSFFLAGPKKQVKNMFAKTRVVATVVYLSSIVLTLFVALYKKIPPKAQVPLILLLIVVQFLALTWYFLSYIPYARDFVTNTCRRTCCACVDK